MAKEIEGYVKLQVRGGSANPSPPVGPALGAKGLNIMEFCKRFNAKTEDKRGQLIPVVITVFKDKSFEFIIKTPPAAVQLMEAAKIKKGIDNTKLRKGVLLLRRNEDTIHKPTFVLSYASLADINNAPGFTILPRLR